MYREPHEILIRVAYSVGKFLTRLDLITAGGEQNALQPPSIAFSGRDT